MTSPSYTLPRNVAEGRLAGAGAQRGGIGPWRTPGISVAEAILGRSEVRLVLEKLEPNRCAVFVVLASDPEDLLDQIFEAEREVIRTYPGWPFDLRVMTPREGWTDSDLKKDAFVVYERPE